MAGRLLSCCPPQRKAFADREAERLGTATYGTSLVRQRGAPRAGSDRRALRRSVSDVLGALAGGSSRCGIRRGPLVYRSRRGGEGASGKLRAVPGGGNCWMVAVVLC